MKKLRKNQGFTLIELVVVMAIIAVLAVLIIGAITVARRSATESANRANARTLQACLEGYFAKNKNYCGGTTGSNDSSHACLASGSVQSIATTITNVAANATYGVTCQASAGVSGGSSGNMQGGGTVSVLTTNKYTIQVANYNGDDTQGSTGKIIDTFKVE